MTLPGCLSLVALLAIACSKPNPDVCCTSTADCTAFGLAEIQPCAPGLTCVGHLCVAPMCSTEGCPATAPICDTASDVCEGCASSADCARFASTDVCNTATGACVECNSASDCSTATAPVCDDHACRACKLDAECPSGACADDGACVPDASIVYMSPAGSDTGMCTRGAPCLTLTFAAGRTAVGRTHIVMKTGAYGEDAYLVPSTVGATPLVVHGGGSSLRTTSDGGLMFVQVEAIVRDLVLIGNGRSLDAGATQPILIERVKITGSNVTGINAGGLLTLRDVVVENSATGIRIGFGDHVTLERTEVRGGVVGISVEDPSARFDFTNVLISGASDVGVDLRYGQAGTMRFSTIANVGSDAGTGPRAIRCPPNGGAGVKIESSIIWAPGIVPRAPIDGCTLSNTIAGPVAVPGADATDPKFVNLAGNDVHLSAASPARDRVETGPTTDIDGEARPRGVRFDIGADEGP